MNSTAHHANVLLPTKNVGKGPVIFQDQWMDHPFTPGKMVI